MRNPLLPLPLLMLAGCAWDAGESFADLHPSVRAAYTPLSKRDAGGGFQRLASDFQVHVSAASLELADIELLGTSADSGGSEEEEGHAHGHAVAGVHAFHEESPAEPASGEESTVVSLPVGGVDLLASQTHAVTCEPSCALPMTTLTHDRWDVTGARFEGSVRDSRQPPRFAGERPFRFIVAAGSEAEPLAMLSGELDVPADRENKPSVTLGLMLDVTPAVFDAVDWGAATVGTDGVVDLNAPENAAARAALLQTLGAFQPTAEVQRDDR